MKLQTLILGLFFCQVLVGCATPINTFVDYDPAYQFEQAKTYAFPKKDKLSQYMSDEDRATIQSTIATQLERRGFRQVDDGSEKLLVNYFLAVSDVEVNRSRSYYDHIAPGMHMTTGIGVSDFGTTTSVAIGYSSGPANFPPKKKLLGSLLIDVIDTESKTLVFQGYAEKDVSKKETFDQETQHIIDAIDKIFDKIQDK